MKLEDIPPYEAGEEHPPCNRLDQIRPYITTNYRVSMFWTILENWIADAEKEYGLELNPDFQRGHVWNMKQRERYVEHILRGGQQGKDVHFNYPLWDTPVNLLGDNPGHMVCVDGLQRVTTARMYIAGEVKAFGYYIHELQGNPEANLRKIGNKCYFHWSIGSFPTREEVLAWYLDINSGGVVHTDEELNKVRRLLAEEKGKK